MKNDRIRNYATALSSEYILLLKEKISEERNELYDRDRNTRRLNTEIFNLKHAYSELRLEYAATKETKARSRVGSYKNAA